MKDNENEKRCVAAEAALDNRAWKSAVAPFQKPNAWRATWQLIDTVGAYVATWVVLYLTLGVSIWLTLALVVLAAGLLVRTFVIFHDCCHGTFYASKRANAFVGFATGVLTFTPYHHWRWEHGLHHATSGNLDKRGVGDVWTMTVHEYQAASLGKRIRYRLARNPVILLGIAPLYLFLVRHRFSSSSAGEVERRSVYVTNLWILILALGLGWLFGLQAYLLLQLGILWAGGMAGVWLFYIQHQFEGAYWTRGDEWNFVSAALKGSSFYRLPKVLKWFSGNIGYHHIHHLSPRIPNYNLQACYESNELFQNVKAVSLRDSLHCFRYRLWDEDTHRLVSFRQLRKQSG